MFMMKFVLLECMRTVMCAVCSVHVCYVHVCCVHVCYVHVCCVYCALCYVHEKIDLVDRNGDPLSSLSWGGGGGGGVSVICVCFYYTPWFSM